MRHFYKNHNTHYNNKHLCNEISIINIFSLTLHTILTGAYWLDSRKRIFTDTGESASVGGGKIGNVVLHSREERLKFLKVS